ncbi:hypothetical protein FRC12_013614 [Ceratobasidium sp. 428]|nr:hypothetical protein FRC12_013614 [Ceratobasidium sp. 428]
MQFKSSLARLAGFVFFLLSFSMLVCAAPAPAPGTGALAVHDTSLVAHTAATEKCRGMLVTLKAELKVKLNDLGKSTSLCSPPRLSAHTHASPRLARRTSVVTCSKTPGCDCTPILTRIANKLDLAVKAMITIAAGIDVTAIKDLWISISIVSLLALYRASIVARQLLTRGSAWSQDILVALKACTGLTIALCANLAAKLCAYSQLLLDTCLTLVVQLAIQLQVELWLVSHPSAFERETNPLTRSLPFDSLNDYVGVCCALGFNVLLALVGL